MKSATDSDLISATLGSGLIDLGGDIANGLSKLFYTITVRSAHTAWLICDHDRCCAIRWSW